MARIKTIKICANPMEITNKCINPDCCHYNINISSHRSQERIKFCSSCGKKLDYRMS